MYLKLCPGLQILEHDGTLEIEGLVQSRVILNAGNYRERNSSELVKARNELRKLCRVGAWRTLCLDVGNLHTVKMNGTTLELD